MSKLNFMVRGVVNAPDKETAKLFFEGVGDFDLKFKPEVWVDAKRTNVIIEDADEST